MKKTSSLRYNQLCCDRWVQLQTYIRRLRPVFGCTSMLKAQQTETNITSRFRLQ